MQRDLGVLLQESQGVGLQVQQVIKKANGILSFIARGMEFKNSEVMLQLYKVLVRPYLEFCVQFWSPYLRKDILALEGVQRRFTGLIPELRGLAYEERLSSLVPYSLELRRMRGDLIETYKIMKGIDKIEAGKLFPRVGITRTRGHSLKIRGSRFRTELRRNFFKGLWDSLSSEAVEATSLNVFNAGIDKFLNSKGIKGYGERAGKWS